MISYSEAEIEHLIHRFERQQLPKVEWTHEAHLVVAVHYVWNYGLENALPLVREFITRHNTSVGTPNTETEGYHETITRFWLIIVDNYLKNHPFSSVKDTLDHWFKEDSSKSNYPLVFYSEGNLFSVHARFNWVEPDLKSLP